MMMMIARHAMSVTKRNGAATRHHSPGVSTERLFLAHKTCQLSTEMDG